MAEEEKPDGEVATEQEESSGSGKKKTMIMGGGLLSLLLVAYIASTMAVPSKDSKRMYEGPFVAPLYPTEVQVNLKGQGNKRYLVMTLNVEYDAYDEAYVTTRTAEPLYQAMLKDALISVSSRKTVEQATDIVEKEVLIDEIREAAGPLLFPIEIGSSGAHGADSESGLRPGISATRSTMRGPLDDHVIHLNAMDRTLRLDDGPVVKYRGTETDLMLSDADGRTVFVDVTRVAEKFEGDVYVGVFGHVRKIYQDSFLIQ